MGNFKFLVPVFLLIGVVAAAGILPMSRGGTGAALTPSANKMVQSAAGTMQLSSSWLVPSGGTVVLAAGGTLASQAPLYIPAGSTLTTKEKGAIESNGTNLYWTDGSGNRYKFNLTIQ